MSTAPTHSLENLDHKALCALNLSFIEKLRCFAFRLDSTHIALATDPDNPPDMELVRFHIHKQFPNLALECTPINDFELFYQKPLLMLDSLPSHKAYAPTSRFCKETQRLLATKAAILAAS